MLGFILDSPPLGRLLPPVSACMPIYNPRANKSVDKTLIHKKSCRGLKVVPFIGSPQAHSDMTIYGKIKRMVYCISLISPRVD